MPASDTPSRRLAIALVVSLLGGLLGVSLLASAADAAPPPIYVVAGDDPNVTGAAWGLHEDYFSDLRAIITNPTTFGASGTVQAVYSIAPPRATPLNASSLNGIDVYFLSGREVDPSEQSILAAFVQQGGALVVSSNAPDFYDTTALLGFTLSPRVVYGDGPSGYDQTHRAPFPSTVVGGQSGHPLVAGPFGGVSTFENWHSVAGFTAVPADATVIARTTLTGPEDNGSAVNATITNVATLAVVPAGARGAGSGPIIATSDVDTFSNAYTTNIGFPATDSLGTLYGTTNGTLARNTFAWIASQLASTVPPTTTTSPPPSTGNGYVALTTPTRILDTRSGIGGPATAFGPGERRVLTVTTAGVPANAEMVSVNITAVDPTAAGFLTVAPAGGPLPDVSNVNFSAGTTVANAALVLVGAGGQVTIYNSGGSTHVLVDVVGYTGPGGSHLVTQSPARIKDTRRGLGGAGIASGAVTQPLAVVGAGGVPADASAVVLNVTAVDPTATAFLTVWPADRPQPTVSNLNTRAGATVANLVIVRLPADGHIDLFNAAGDTHLLVDVLGWFTPADSGADITATVPHRVIDTRSTHNALQPGEIRTVGPGAPGARGVVINVTAVDPAAVGYLTVYPSGTGQPDTSTLNFAVGRNTPNLVVVPVGANGTIDIYNSAGATELLIDVVARFD